MAKVRPYSWHHHHRFVGQAAHIGRFMVHCALMLLFSALLYWRGEQVAQGIRHFATRRRRSWRCRRAAGGTGYPRGGAGCGGDG